MRFLFISIIIVSYCSSFGQDSAFILYLKKNIRIPLVGEQVSFEDSLYRHRLFRIKESSFFIITFSVKDSSYIECGKLYSIYSEGKKLVRDNKWIVLKDGEIETFNTIFFNLLEMRKLPTKENYLNL